MLPSYYSTWLCTISGKDLTKGGIQFQSIIKRGKELERISVQKLKSKINWAWVKYNLKSECVSGWGELHPRSLQSLHFQLEVLASTMQVRTVKTLLVWLVRVERRIFHIQKLSTFDRRMLISHQPQHWKFLGWKSFCSPTCLPFDVKFFFQTLGWLNWLNHCNSMFFYWRRTHWVSITQGR